MASLKIDIIVDDKGRPVIDRTTASMRELSTTTRTADASMKSHGNSANVAGSNMAGLTRTVLRLYAAYYVLSQGIQAVTGLVMQGVGAIDKYNLSIAKMAAMMTGMMEPNGMGLADQYRQAYGYAGQLNVMIEQVDKNTLLTANDLRMITEEMMKQGVVVDTTNKKQIEAFTNISNALAVIAAGAPNKEIQLRQEIRSLLSGQLRDTDQLSKMLNAQTGNLKEQIAKHREQGDLIEWLGQELRGFAAAQGDINASWEATKTSLETIYEQILREGFQTAFKDINESVKKLSQWAIEHKAEIGEVLNNGYVAIRDVIQDTVGIFAPWKDEMKGILQLTKDVFTAISAGITMTKNISEGLKQSYNQQSWAMGPFAGIADTLGFAYTKTQEGERDKHLASVVELVKQGATTKNVTKALIPTLKPAASDDDDKASKKAAKLAEQEKEAMSSWLEKAQEMDPFLDQFSKKKSALVAEAEKLTRKWGEQTWITQGLKTALDNLELDKVIKEYEELGKKVKEFADEETLATKAVVDYGYEQVKALEDIYYTSTKNLQGFDDEFATATANAQNELEALLTAEKSFIKDSKGQWDELKEAIDGWGKDSAQAIADFAVKGAGSFSDMIESMIADMMKMVIYQNITGPLSRSASSGITGFLGNLFSGGFSAGSSMGYGDWTAGLAFHNGGRVGLDNPTFVQALPSSMFGSAPRYHSGLNYDEFPAILQKGETVIPRGGSSSPSVNVIINNNNNSDVSQQSQPNGNGGIDLIVTVDNLVAKNLNKHGSSSSKALRKGYGARPTLTGR